MVNKFVLWGASCAFVLTLLVLSKLSCKVFTYPFHYHTRNFILPISMEFTDLRSGYIRTNRSDLLSNLVLYKNKNDTNGNANNRRHQVIRRRVGGNPYKRKIKDGDNLMEDDLDESQLPLCPQRPPGLAGRIPVSFATPTLFDLERGHTELDFGGAWRPNSCRARWKVALIVPYRSRELSARAFLHHMHPFLQKQQLDYTIYIVEQLWWNYVIFNRLRLLNIGFLEANEIDDYDCFIFHDVDLLPINDNNLYWCSEQPRHLAFTIYNTSSGRDNSAGSLGGAFVLNKLHIMRMNGFSNDLFGRGDDDRLSWMRLRDSGLVLNYPPDSHAQYVILHHGQDTGNPHEHRNVSLESLRRRRREDGLNSVRYSRWRFEMKSLFTYVGVYFNGPTLRKT